MDREQKYLMDQLAEETFSKDIDEFSYKRVEALVQLMEVNEPTDSEEVEDAQKEFEKKFRQMTAKKHRINVQKIAQTAAIICILILGANLTTEALMNDNVFHMIQRWSNRYEIIPSDNEVEYQESDVKVFTDIEEFESYFGDDFLVCSWLPDGYKLEKIKQYCVDNIQNYYWTFSNKENKKILVQIFNKENNDIASLVGASVELTEQSILNNGISAMIGQSEDEFLGCFEYGKYWYIIQVEDKNSLLAIIGGMVKYEKN